VDRWTAIIAEPDSDANAQIAAAAGRLGYRTLTASSTAEVVAAARHSPSRVVLAALDLDGLEPKQLRRDLGDTPGHTHLVYLLPSASAAGTRAAFEAGADDVLAKPLIDIELHVRLRHSARVLALEEMCAHIQGEAALFDAISARASFHSRGYFDAQLATELARASRFAHSLSVALAHVESDPWDERDMRSLGRFLSGRFRSDVDWVARYDDRRIALVFPETTLSGALRAAERLNHTLGSAERAALNLPDQLSIKYGVMALDATQLSGHAAPPDTRLLMEAAEACLDDALRSGRNIVGGHHALQ
jgi:PleD family two-component response regulator